MDVWIWALGALAAIAFTLFGAFYSNHKSPGIALFATGAIFTIIAGCLYWQSYLWKQDAEAAAKPNTPPAVAKEQSPPSTTEPPPVAPKHIIKEPKPQSKENQPASSNDNRFFDFRVVDEDDKNVTIDIGYYYNGSLGNKEVFITVELLDSKGKRLPRPNGGTLYPVEIKNSNALARLHLRHAPPDGEIHRSATFEVCMTNDYVEVFHCQRFNYIKTWK